MIALKKEELVPMPSNLPCMVALIDEPGPFGNNLLEWQQFLAEMEQLPDSVQKRQTVNNAKQMIAMRCGSMARVGDVRRASSAPGANEWPRASTGGRPPPPSCIGPVPN